MKVMGSNPGNFLTKNTSTLQRQTMFYLIGFICDQVNLVGRVIDPL